MFRLDIDTGNAAFHTDAGGAGRDELARLLRLAADRIEEGRNDGALLDINGNTVGDYELTDPVPS